jgi:hypothetical protein
MLYVIIADGTFDQVCTDKRDMERERRDLKRMGCTVKVKPVASWQEADAIETRMAGR